MTIVAVWCRHENDNVIGIGPHIPWHISSDFKRFKRLTEGQALIAGEKTYESFPNRTLPNRKIYILTFNQNYEVSDKDNHFVVTDINTFKDMHETLYISGGASVYKAFMTGDFELQPDVVVDCCYHGALDPTLQGPKVDITPCVEVLLKNYKQISENYLEDNVTTRVLVKTGDFVEQSVLKHIIEAIENKEINK